MERSNSKQIPRTDPNSAWQGAVHHLAYNVLKICSTLVPTLDPYGRNKPNELKEEIVLEKTDPPKEDTQPLPGPSKSLEKDDESDEDDEEYFTPPELSEDTESRNRFLNGLCKFPIIRCYDCYGFLSKEYNNAPPEMKEVEQQPPAQADKSFGKNLFQFPLIRCFNEEGDLVDEMSFTSEEDDSVYEFGDFRTRGN